MRAWRLRSVACPHVGPHAGLLLSDTRRSAAGARCLGVRLLLRLHIDISALAKHIVQSVDVARRGGGIFARSSGSKRGDGVGAAEASVGGGSGGLDVVLWEHLHAVASAGGVCKE